MDATHKQDLPLDFKFNGKLDLESDSSFNKTFEDNVNKRSRRSSDSFGYIHRSWADTTVDILARYRDSSEENRDDTFAHLPDATFSSLQQPIAGGPFYFNQDSNYTFFHLDLNPDPATDDNHDIHRMDFHPQLSLPMKISPWLSFTPTVGIRGTFYSDGLDAGNNSTDSFSRESFDIRAAFEGPKINRVFSTGQGQAVAGDQRL